MVIYEQLTQKRGVIRAQTTTRDAGPINTSALARKTSTPGVQKEFRLCSISTLVHSAQNVQGRVPWTKRVDTYLGEWLVPRKANSEMTLPTIMNLHTTRDIVLVVTRTIIDALFSL